MEKRLIYMDNAATSFPKADGVAEASAYYLTQAGVNVARGGYSLAYEVGENVFQARKKTAEMFGVKDPHRVIFTAGATTAINMMIKGLLRAGDKVLVSSLEHNAVMRPLNQIKADFYRADFTFKPYESTKVAQIWEKLKIFQNIAESQQANLSRLGGF